MVVKEECRGGAAPGEGEGGESKKQPWDASSESFYSHRLSYALQSSGLPRPFSRREEVAHVDWAFHKEYACSSLIVSINCIVDELDFDDGLIAFIRLSNNLCHL